MIRHLNVKSDLLSSVAYAAQCKDYRVLCDQLSTDSFVLNGHNCTIKVQNGALSIRPGSVSGEEHNPLLFHRGTHNISQIIITSHSGFVSVDALYWCRDQGISLLLLDGHGDQVYSIVPERKDSASLRRLQYMAEPSGRSLQLAKLLIQMKTRSQVETIVKHTELRNRDHALDVLRCGLTELETDDYRFQDIDYLRLHEGRLAAVYFDSFLGLPIRWSKSDERIVPPHWMKVTNRTSPLSASGTARYAICPFHAALNYLYTVVEHHILCAIHAAGLDPACGVLHADKENRDSLVYDLIEPLRPRIDDMALDFFARTTFKRGDIVPLRTGQVLFNAEFARYLLASCSSRSWNCDDVVGWFKSSLLSE